MSLHSSRRSSICTVLTKSSHRSSSNLALIQEQSTPPTGSPILDRSSPDFTDNMNMPTGDPTDDTTPLNPNTNFMGGKTMDSMLADVEEGKKASRESGRRKSITESTWVQYARVILPHVGMVVLCVMYALAGATVFYVIERPQERHIRNNNLQMLRRTRENFLRELWEMSSDRSVTKNQFRLAAFEKSDEFIKRFFESLDEGGYMSPAAVRDFLSTSTILNEKEKKQMLQQTANKNSAKAGQQEIIQRKETSVPDMWSFGGALLFATATLTTVGYGQIAPVTTLGRLLCVAFGLLGIPLTLMTIADIGKFLGEGLKRIYRLCQRCRKGTRTCIRMCFRRSLRNQPFHQLQNREEDINSNVRKDENRKNSDTKCEKEKAADEKPTENETNEKTTTEAKAAEEFAAVLGSLPVEWIFLVIVAYTFMGAGLFTATEPWSLLESFYFCFMTMTTIGYGDFVPLNQNYFGLTLLYIVLGLAITTMSIDQAGSQYIKKIHYFGRKIQSAKQALSHVRNMISYANWVKRRYGLTDQQLRQMTYLPEFYGMQELLARSGAYVPDCYKRLYFIDQRTESMLEEIFTITTESDQELDADGTAETEFRTRNDHVIPLSRDKASPWAKAKRHLFKQQGPNNKLRLSPSYASLQPTPSSLMGQHIPNFREMSHLERIAALQRIRQATPGGSYKQSGAGRRTPLSRETCGTGLVEITNNKTSYNNNNQSPKLISNSETAPAIIDRQLTTTNEVDGSLISL